MDYLFSNNQGGVSKNDYASLNVSPFTGDDPVCVKRNRLLVKRQVGTTILVSTRQVHGDRIYFVESAPTSDLEVDGYDALVTSCPNIALMVQLADCQGILLHDPEVSVVAGIHCGWRGNVINIIGKTVLELEDTFGSNPSRIRAFISPSLGPCCAEFVNFRDELPQSFQRFQVKDTYFDFWEISKSQLVESGLDETNISVSGICTSCSKDYFSYRRARRNGDGTTGRHSAVIRL